LILVVLVVVVAAAVAAVMLVAVAVVVVVVVAVFVVFNLKHRWPRSCLSYCKGLISIDNNSSAVF